jgi:hypothetical protein
VVALMLVNTNTVNAVSFSSVEVNEVIDFVCDVDGFGIFIWDNPSLSGANFEGLCDGTIVPVPQPSWIDEIDGNTFSINLVGTYYVEVYDEIGNTTIEQFNFDAIDVQNSNIWGGSNGFWGNTTVGDVTTAMEASVQATGANVWGLLTFVGLPIAFLLAGLLLYMIKKELTPVSVTKNQTKKDNFIYHSPEDLEFKREYGQEKTKRKRGRPRKIL